MTNNIIVEGLPVENYVTFGPDWVEAIVGERFADDGMTSQCGYPIVSVSWFGDNH